MNMDCEEARILISADLDGQLEDPVALRSHLDECAACRDWRVRAEQLPGRMPGPVTAAALPHGFLAYRWVRFALGWAGLLLIVWSIPGVFETVSDETYQHVWRHQHAFGIALGLTFLFVAWRPDRAYGLVPVAATFTVALAGAAIYDLVAGSTPLSRETKHLVEIAGLGLLWALGWSAGPGHHDRDREDADAAIG
jgi:predicted anti-sigma-YlaC factor YlaD